MQYVLQNPHMQEFFYLTYTLHTHYIFTQYILECYMIYFCLEKRFACGNCLVPRLNFITLCGTTIQYGFFLFDLHTILPYILTQYILECYIICYCLQKRFACGDCLYMRDSFITLYGPPYVL
jgi:hypothetical protein